jgi:hypothetical protein
VAVRSDRALPSTGRRCEPSLAARGEQTYFVVLVTTQEIIEEIKQLPLGEQAQVERFIRELKRPLAPEELGRLAEQLAGERDPERARALMEEMTAGFYGGSTNA